MPAKTVKLPGKRHLPSETEPAIARLREITAQSADNQFLGEGPAHPDAELLDLCADALHHMVAAERALKELRALPLAEFSWRDRDPRVEEYRRDRDRVFDEWQTTIKKAKPIMGRIRKRPARSPVAIYAKALVVRASRTAAPILAMSLAEDLIACPGLRVSLWPAEVQP